MRPDRFALLPDELLAHIFSSRRSSRELCALCRVCHRFHQVEAHHQDILWYDRAERRFEYFTWPRNNPQVTALDHSGWKYRYAYLCALPPMSARPDGRGRATCRRMGAWIKHTFEFHLVLVGSNCKSWKSELVKFRPWRDTCTFICSDAAPFPMIAPDVVPPQPPLESEYVKLELHATRRTGGPSVRVLELPMPSGWLLRKSFGSSDTAEWTARLAPQWAEEELSISFECYRSQGWRRPTRSSPPSAACLWEGVRFVWDRAVPELFVALHARLMDRPGMGTCQIRIRPFIRPFRRYRLSDDETGPPSRMQVSDYNTFYLQNVQIVQGDWHERYIFECSY